MNPYTGQTVLFTDLKTGTVTEAAQYLGCTVADLIRIDAEPGAVDALSRRVRLGATELDRRKARRKQQRASRRTNR